MIINNKQILQTLSFFFDCFTQIQGIQNATKRKTNYEKNKKQNTG